MFFVANASRATTQHISLSAVAKKSPAILLYASSADADQLYFTRFSGPDPFIAFGIGRKKYGVLSALEFGRGRREGLFDEVLPLEFWLQKAQKRFPGRPPGIAAVIFLLARDRGVKTFAVPANFPAGLAQKLTALGLRLAIADGAFFPAREVKTPAEIAALREGNRCSALGIGAAEKVLRAARIKNGRLFYEGRPLTSERLKVAIETACLEAGALSIDTIAAGGDQACDPHCRGTGPLRARQLIIVDVFPRVTKTGYHGDMTRTFLKGRASDAQRRLVAAVAAAQQAALRVIRAGVDARKPHQAVVDTFAARGYETKHTPEGSVGFFHGTGHGLGLDVHEPPRMSAAANLRLKKGSVVTVEPGLYYPGLGACRIEDVVQVTAAAPRMLSNFPRAWELR